MIPFPSAIARRQDAPRGYDVTPVAYAAQPEFTLPTSPIVDHRVKAVSALGARPLDNQTEFDFRVAECPLQQKGQQA